MFNYFKMRSRNFTLWVSTNSKRRTTETRQLKINLTTLLINKCKEINQQQQMQKQQIKKMKSTIYRIKIKILVKIQKNLKLTLFIR
jgi:hypothetical protein